METKDLCSKVFSIEPQNKDCRKIWTHWYRTFADYVQKYNILSHGDKLSLLINHVDSTAYEVILESKSFEEAINELQKVYALAQNPIFARYLLKICRQQIGQLLDVYFQKLKSLSMDSNFAAVPGIQHKEEAVRDAFICGLALPELRQRILENSHLDLQAMLAMARSLHTARNNSLQFDNLTPTSSRSCTTFAKSAKDCPRTDAAVALRHRKCQTMETLITLGDFVQQKRYNAFDV